MAELMRKVMTSVATPQAIDNGTAQTGMPGWVSALVYLCLAALVVVVAFGRRLQKRSELDHRENRIARQLRAPLEEAQLDQEIDFRNFAAGAFNQAG